MGDSSDGNVEVGLDGFDLSLFCFGGGSDVERVFLYRPYLVANRRGFRVRLFDDDSRFSRGFAQTAFGLNTALPSEFPALVRPQQV